MNEENATTEVVTEDATCLSSGMALSLLDGDMDSLVTSDDGNTRAISDITRDAAKLLVKVHDKSTIALAQVLCQIKEREWYATEYGHSSFDAYVENELEFQSRKAYSLVNIWTKLVVDRNIDVEMLRERSWSKLKEIAAIANDDAIDTNSLMQLIAGTDTMTTSDVALKAKQLAVTSHGGDAGAVEVTKRMSFNLYPAQTAMVTAALSAASTISGSEKHGANLEFVATEFVASHIGGASEDLKKVAMSLGSLEGVDIMVVKNDTVLYASDGLAKLCESN